MTKPKEIQKNQEAADLQKRQEDRSKGKIYPDSAGTLHKQPIDAKTDKEMPGFIKSHQKAKKRNT